MWTCPSLSVFIHVVVMFEASHIFRMVCMGSDSDDGSDWLYINQSTDPDQYVFI